MKSGNATVHLDLGYLAFFTGQQINRRVRERLRTAGFRDVRDAHGFVFQHLIGGGRSISSLGERMGITQQAASKRVAEMLELGYVEIDPASKGRTRLVVISARGWKLIEASRSIRATIHAELRARLNPKDLAATSRLLRRALDQLGGLQPALQRRVPEPEAAATRVFARTTAARRPVVDGSRSRRPRSPRPAT